MVSFVLNDAPLYSDVRVWQIRYQKLNRPAAATTGQTALSNYILQSVLLGLIFYGYGFGQFNQWSRSQLLVWVVMIWLVQVVLTSLWLRRYKQGPLEYLWRRLTYRGFSNTTQTEKTR